MAQSLDSLRAQVAGVGVGSAIGVLAIAALCVFFFRRRKAAETEHGDGRSGPESANPAMTSPFGSGGITHEAGPASIYETGMGQSHEIGGVAVEPIHEASADNEIHEIFNPRNRV